MRRRNHEERSRRAGERRSEQSRRGRRALRSALRHPFFPHTFLFRNIQVLTAEESWAAMPNRLRRLLIRRLLIERCRFFREVLRCRPAQPVLPKSHRHIRLALDTDEIIGYCDDCGECCEFGSGYPDFPDPAVVPASWRRAFSEGLGRSHRFCPFLWEVARSGRSVCAIHKWRPNACRIFEEYECRWLKNDRDGAMITSCSQASSRWLRPGRLFRSR